MKKYCLSAWNFVDPLYFQFTRLEYIKKTGGDNSIFRVRLTKYKGRNIVLSDGTTITKNDVIVKIHLHNAKLLQKMYRSDNEIKRALIIYKGIKESLPSLVHYIQSHEKADRIKGLIGITTLYRGCKKLGFEAHPIASPTYKNFKKISLLPIYFLSSSRGIRKEIPSPMYLFMSKDALISRYTGE
ncbi:hypothetical protein K0H71_17835 [Bacillus sp. IITD106]|nr:hypothetical protein [Bacillus sp. IITD106]